MNIFRLELRKILVTRRNVPVTSTAARARSALIWTSRVRSYPAGFLLLSFNLTPKSSMNKDKTFFFFFKNQNYLITIVIVR